MRNKKTSIFNTLLFFALFSCNQLYKIGTNDNSLSILSCVDSSGDLSVRSMSVQGGPSLVVQRSQSFSLLGIQECENINSITWLPADGNAATLGGLNFNHSYTLPGLYSLQADIIDNVPHSYRLLLPLEVKSICSGEECDALKEIFINAPQISIKDREVIFNLVVPEGYTDISQVAWTMGDESNDLPNDPTLTHTFSEEGAYTVSAVLTDGQGNTFEAKHLITVLDSNNSFPENCSPEHIRISSPTVSYKNSPVNLRLSLPDCMTEDLGSLSWNFGGDSASTQTQNTVHTFGTPGYYPVTVSVTLTGDSAPVANLVRWILIKDGTPPPSPCAQEDERITQVGDIYTRVEACGNDGTKVLSYRDTATLICQDSEQGLFWEEISNTTEKISETPCEGQSCSGFGVHGTIKTGIVIGSVNVPKICSFNENGIIDTYEQLEDKTCNNGVVNSSNQRNGNLIVAGVCSTYQWQAGAWSVCSADCGGQQTQSYSCVNNSGVASDEARCTTAKPTPSRACDGNPAIQRFVDSQQTRQEALLACPVNQIGVVNRTYTTSLRTTQSCVQHSYQNTSTIKIGETYVDDPHCMPLVPHRCSHDSLNTPMAEGRYAWMQKCANSHANIKDFLTNYNDIRYGDSSLTSGRRIYATFLNAGNNDLPWIAPTSESSSCDNIPQGAYVAAVCVSSCVTAQENILASLSTKGEEESLSFLEALSAKAPRASIVKVDNSGSLKRTLKPVDLWITELVDSQHAMLKIRTRSGASINVTPNHPLLDGQGIMREAESFNIGDALVRANGDRDSITSIESFSHQGKVYNLMMKSGLPEDNIVVTNGFLNGTALFQNQGVQFMNREVLRKNLIKDAL